MSDDRRIGSTQTQDWKPGDDPTTHPLWDEQVELEKQFGEAGTAEYTAKIDKARREGDTSSLRSRFTMMDTFVLPVIDHIRKDMQRVENNVVRSGSNVVPLYYRFIKFDLADTEEEGREIAAIVTLRCMFNGITNGERGGSDSVIAGKIGQQLVECARMFAWQKADREEFEKMERWEKHDRSTARHNRRKRSRLFNRDYKSDLGFKPLDEHTKCNVGAWMIKFVAEATGHFVRKPDPYFTSVPGSYTKPQTFLFPSEELLSKLMELDDFHAWMHCEFPPTIMPPKRWGGIRGGGYYTRYLRSPLLIQLKHAPDDQRRNSIDEYDALSMPAVYKALHVLQETPWKINERVLKVAELAWLSGKCTGGLPERVKNVPPRLSPAASKKAKKQNSDWIRERHAYHYSQLNKVLSTSRIIRMARDFRDRKSFYFPHRIDFRGRYYPIPSDLQPQGNDLARGLLTFAEAKSVKPEDAGRWLAIHLANCFGHDKWTHDERIAWVMDLTRQEDWKRVDKSPRGYADIWEAAKDPYQALAAIFEWVAFQKHLEQHGPDGPLFMSSLPIVVDATCSGLQHLSALTLDEETGKSVNLTGILHRDHETSPSDIYREVAIALTDKLRKIKDAGGDKSRMGNAWLKLCADEEGRKFPRSLTKGPVMTLPYGSKHLSTRASIKEWVKGSKHRAFEYKNFDEECGDGCTYDKMVSMLATTLRKVTKDRTGPAMTTMGWLTKCAKVIADNTKATPVDIISDIRFKLKKNMTDEEKEALSKWRVEPSLSLNWTTASGFVVRQYYCATKRKRVKVPSDGTIFQISFVEPIESLDENAQLNGIAPNFIHSQDSALLTLAVDALRKQGVTGLTSIHDCLGSHAADMSKVEEAVRLAFVAIYQRPVLEDFRNECIETLVIAFLHHASLPGASSVSQEEAYAKADELLDEVPPMGNLNLNDVLGHPYFFS